MMLNYLVIRLTARCRTERGATAVEYGLLVASVALMGFAAFKLWGTLESVFVTENSNVGTVHNTN